MSDRKQLLNLPTGVKDERLELYMDGESGTWRLFVCPDGNIGDDVELTLEALRKLSKTLSEALSHIDLEPDKWNAEVRAKWDDTN